jgi:selenocysteine-specific elongation factor
VLVLDADPPALTRRGAAARRAVELGAATGVPDAGREVARRGAVHRSQLRALGVPLDHLGDVRVLGEWLVADTTWHGWVTALPGALDAWLADSPLDVGAPLDALRHALDVPDRELLKTVVTEAGLAVHDGRVVRPGQDVSLGASSGAVDTVRRRLEHAPFAAPEQYDLDELGLGRRELAAAERAGLLLRISDEIVLLPSATDLAVDTLRALPQPFTLSRARQALGTTRRVAVPLLEYLDAHGFTERVDQLTRRVP